MEVSPVAKYLNTKELVPGIVMNVVAVGGKLMQTYVTLKKGAELPVHTHPHEQSSFVISGHMVFTVDGVEHDCPAGSGLVFAPNQPHGARILEDTCVADVFTPIREEYLK